MAVRRVSFSETEPEVREFVSEPHEPDGSDSEFEEEAAHAPCPVPRPLWELIKEKDAHYRSNGHLASETLGGRSFDPGPRPLWEMIDDKAPDVLPKRHANAKEANTIVLPSWRTGASQENGSLPHKSRDPDASKPSGYPLTSLSAPPQLKANGTHLDSLLPKQSGQTLPQLDSAESCASAPSKPPRMNGLRKSSPRSKTPISFDDERVRVWLDCASFGRLAKTSRTVWKRCVDEKTGLALVSHISVPSPEMWQIILTRVDHMAALSARGVCPSTEDTAGQVLAALKTAPHFESLDWTGPLPSPDVPRLHLAPFLASTAEHLRSLRLVGCDLGGPRAGCRYLSRALRNATRLEDFDLSENAIDGTAAIHIADLLARGVPTHSLVLDGNPVGEAGAEKLVLGLKSIASSPLQRLFLRGCGIPERSPGALALDAAAESIKVVLE